MITIKAIYPLTPTKFIPGWRSRFPNSTFNAIPAHDGSFILDQFYSESWDVSVTGAADLKSGGYILLRQRGIKGRDNVVLYSLFNRSDFMNPDHKATSVQSHLETKAKVKFTESQLIKWMVLKKIVLENLD